jgi:hypothetical protein
MAKSEIQKYSMREELKKADQTYQGSLALLGMTALTFPGYINSMRSTMFTSHLKQFVNLLEPEFPLVFTNAENVIGRHSTAYKKVKHRCKVYRKISKFDDIMDEPYIYKLFIFDEETKKFDVVTRKVCEDLTENFGFDYNNTEIDKYDDGDIIPADTVLYKSTSYDEDMNYAYGRNVNVMYTLDPFTSEDAATASKSLAKTLSSIETEVITIGLNDNDYFINLQGENETWSLVPDKKGKYKPLPDIGEIVSGHLAAIRRQFNNQLLFDFKADSLNKIQDGDVVYYIGNGNQVIDYTIYNNNEDLVDTVFSKQINKYLRSQNAYYKKILDTCIEIIQSGYEYSREIDYLYKRASEMLDDKKKWKENDKAFSNMVIKITVRKVRPLTKGQKLTGRFGNKSVISEILDDEDMPFTEDGRRVDLMLNLLAIINRTTSFPLFEMMINSITYQIRKKMAATTDYKEKEKLLFDIVYELNEQQHEKIWKEYLELPEEEKKDYIDDAIENGIYIHQNPLWETKPIFYRLRDILEKYPWLTADNVYVRKWGRTYKTLQKAWIGQMYIIKLKQSPVRGHSVRSTGALDTKGLPTRSYRSRSHLEQYSGTPIRFGEFETLNFSIGVIPDDIALFHALYRTSIKGRKDLVKLLFDDDSNGVQKIDASYTSRVAEIFNVILKSMSVGLDFVDESNFIYNLDNNTISMHTLDGNNYFCTDYEFFLIKRKHEIRQEILEENPVITTEELDKRVEEVLKTRDYVMGEKHT